MNFYLTITYLYVTFVKQLGKPNKRSLTF